MELRQLKYFLQAKKTLNFTEAAFSLHISQSTLSQQIQQLENELKTPLFNRIGKRVTLTEAGSLFAYYAEHTVNKANEGILMLQDLNTIVTGKLSIGVTYGLRHIFNEALLLFTSQYPGITFEIIFGTSEELHKKLLDLEIDFILTFKESKSYPNLIYTSLFTSPLSLISAKEINHKNVKGISLKEVSELPLALPAKGYSTSNFIQELFQKENLKPHVSIEINDIPTLIDIVKSGKWYTILTKSTVINEKEIFTVPLLGKDMTRTAMLISLKDIYQKKAAGIFQEILFSLAIRFQQ